MAADWGGWLLGWVLNFDSYWRYQGKVAGLPNVVQKYGSSPTVCLNYTVVYKNINNTELYLTLSKCVDKLLVAKCLINIKHFSWKY